MLNQFIQIGLGRVNVLPIQIKSSNFDLIQSDSMGQNSMSLFSI
jgi:hypothetical protein